MAFASRLLSLAHFAARSTADLKPLARVLFFSTQARSHANAITENTGAIAPSGEAMALTRFPATVNAGSAIFPASIRFDSIAAAIVEKGISTKRTVFESPPFWSIQL